MNKLYSLAAVAALVSAISILAPVSALADGTFGFGLHGGVNLSDLEVKRTGSATINANKDNDVGVVAGAHFELGTDILTLRPEANYSTRGFTFANTLEVTEKYLEVPVLVKLHLLPGIVQPFIEAGPQLGIHLSNEVNAFGLSTNVDGDSSSVDFSGVAGAGLRIAIIDALAVDAEARYVYGFTDQNGRDDIEVRTRGFQLLAGLTFRY